MSETYLKGYEPNTRPETIKPEQAQECLEILTSSNARLIGSVIMSKDAKNVTVGIMTHLVETGRRYGSLESGAFAGPLLLNGQLVTGRAIGIWEQLQSDRNVQE